MAEGKGNSESDNSPPTEHTLVSIHQQMTDAGQFSYGALCALCLRKLFEEEWNKNFNQETLLLILNGLEQPKQVQEAIQAMYNGVGQEDVHPFIEVILKEDVLQGDASPVISELINFAVGQGNYDARMRALIKHIAWRLHVGWDHMEEIECQLAETITAQKYQMSQEEKAEQQKKAKHSKYKRAALIGLATVTGGTLIGLTGGLAAPLVAAGAGALIGGAGAAALGSAAGVAIIGSLFGVAGAGLTGYKMKRRVGAIEEFEFEPLISGGPLQLQTIRQQLHITIAITGWIDKKMPDFKQPWQNLAESQEQYTLRWESRYLRDLGQALDYIFDSAVSIATHEALKYTVLSTLMAAITWPAALLSVSQVIDNPWSVALQRAVAAGRQLAEVLLSREQGKRPVTLIGYSLGGRVIFYCLEEMAKRKGAEGIVEDVIILGAPVTGDPKAWAAFQRVIAGRIINGYCRGDWLLKFLYRTSSVQIHIAGLGPVKWNNHRMNNIDLSDVVSGHLDYMKQLDNILRVVGIRVRQGVKVTEKAASGLTLMASSSTITSKDSDALSVSECSTSVSSSSVHSLSGPVAVATEMTEALTLEDKSASGTQCDANDAATSATSSPSLSDQASSGSQPVRYTDQSNLVKSPSQSIGGKLKNFFSRKKDSLSPEPRQDVSDPVEDAESLAEPEDSQWVLLGGAPALETKNLEINNPSPVANSGNTSSTTACSHQNTLEENREGNTGEAGRLVQGDKTEEHADEGDLRDAETVQTGECGNRRIETRMEKADKTPREEIPVSVEQVVVGEGGETIMQLDESEQDTYTSSNPGSSPEEEVS